MHPILHNCLPSFSISISSYVHAPLRSRQGCSIGTVVERQTAIYTFSFFPEGATSFPKRQCKYAGCALEYHSILSTLVSYLVSHVTLGQAGASRTVHASRTVIRTVTSKVSDISATIYRSSFLSLLGRLGPGQ